MELFKISIIATARSKYKDITHLTPFNAGKWKKAYVSFQVFFINITQVWGGAIYVRIEMFQRHEECIKTGNAWHYGFTFDRCLLEGSVPASQSLPQFIYGKVFSNLIPIPPYRLQENCY